MSYPQQPPQNPYGQNPSPPPPPYGQGQGQPQDAPQGGVPPYQQAPYGQNPYAPQQPYGQYAQPGYGMPPEPKWNGLAIAGFVFSFIIALVGLILSIVALSQINKSGGTQKGKGLAIAGIVISILSILFTLLAVVAGVTSGSTSP